MTDADERDPLDWGPVYPERIAVGYMPTPELPPIAPPRGVLRAIRNKLIGAHMDLESLKADDLAMTARGEILARLRQPSSADIEVCRQLDELVDECERSRSRNWSSPLDGNTTYHARIASVLSLAAAGLDIGQGRGAASIGGWETMVDSGMFYVQCYRRRDLWGVALPDFLIPPIRS